MDNWFMLFLTRLLYQLPMLLVYLIGALLALIGWQRHPSVSLITMLAIGLMFVDRMATTVLYTWLPRNLDAIGWTHQQMAGLFTVVSILSSLVSAIAFGLLLWAIFSGRQRSNAV